MTISANAPARVVVLLITVAVVLVLLLATGVGATVAGTAADDGYVTHRVVAGDTLWDIASGCTDPSEDVRRTVHEIRRINDLDGSLIVPGQVLRIPASG
jgi:LysM repeat protein